MHRQAGQAISAEARGSQPVEETEKPSRSGPPNNKQDV